MLPSHPLTLAVLLTVLALGGAPRAVAQALASRPAQPATAAAPAGFDGSVEAVRQSTIAAQVTGAVIELHVKAGDKVAAGQVLLRLDARVAQRSAAAGDAQAAAARAAADNAAAEFERQRQLFQMSYISQAALDAAEARLKTSRAQLAAQDAQAGAARIETGLHVIRAPFAGTVAEVPVAVGDMALPGRALVTLFDPAALRVAVAVPQSVAARLATGQPPRIELPGLPAAQRWLTPLRVQVLPTVDAATHTVPIRLELPLRSLGLAPGMFARVWLALDGDGAEVSPRSPVVPLSAVVRRAELTGLYVIDASGRPTLRQVRLGPVRGDHVEILAGLALGERVATDPQAAARARDPR